MEPQEDAVGSSLGGQWWRVVVGGAWRGLRDFMASESLAQWGPGVPVP